MNLKELKELADKYPNNYELGEEVRKILRKSENKKINDGNILWMGFLFIFIFASLLIWIVSA